MHLATPYDTNKKIDQFPIGIFFFFLVEYNYSVVKGRGPSHKLMPFKHGPYKVVSNIGTRYTLLDLITSTRMHFYIDYILSYMTKKTWIPTRSPCATKRSMSSRRFSITTGNLS